MTGIGVAPITIENCEKQENKYNVDNARLSLTRIIFMRDYISLHNLS